VVSLLLCVGLGELQKRIAVEFKYVLHVVLHPVKSDVCIHVHVK